jgi:hypothetical protein
MRIAALCGQVLQAIPWRLATHAAGLPPGAPAGANSVSRSRNASAYETLSVHVLGQKRFHARMQGNRLVEQRIRSGDVRPYVDEVAIAPVARIKLFEATHALHLFRAHQGVHGTTDRRLDVDRGIVTGLREIAREHDVPIEDRRARHRQSGSCGSSPSVSTV